MSIELVTSSNQLILYWPLLFQPSIFSASGSFPMSLLFIRQPKYWTFSFSISPSNEHPGLISFGIDCWISWEPKGLSRVFSSTTDQKHQFSALSFLYSPILTSIHDYWKNHSLDQMDIVGKVMSLLFNMLSRLVITFLPRKKHLLISWLQSPSAVILRPHPKKIKSVTVSIASPSICHEVMGPDAMILVF